MKKPRNRTKPKHGNSIIKSKKPGAFCKSSKNASHTFPPDSGVKRKGPGRAPTCRALSGRTPSKVQQGCKAPLRSCTQHSPNSFKCSKQQSNCRQMQGFDTVISPENPLNMPAKVEEVYSFCHLQSSAKREGDAKKGAEGALRNFANRQFIHSKRAREKSTQNTRGEEEEKFSSKRNYRPYVIISHTHVTKKKKKRH